MSGLIELLALGRFVLLHATRPPHALFRRAPPVKVYDQTLLRGCPSRQLGPRARPVLIMAALRRARLIAWRRLISRDFSRY